MSVPSITNGNILQLISQQKQLYNQLQYQLGSGQKAQNYADLGVQRLATLDANSQIAAYDGFSQTISQLNVRLDVAQNAFDRFNSVITSQRGANTTTTFKPLDGTQTAQQKLALSQLDEVLGLLNSDAGGRKLFSGRAVTSDASLNSSDIINGAGGKAGLSDVISERNRADLGSDGLGRLQQTFAGTTTTLSETASGVFGLKIAGASGNLTNGTITNNSGPPANAVVDFTGLPNSGDSVNISFTLPDGTNDTLTLTAVSGQPADGQFQIGADAATTAANFNTVLNNQVKKLAAGDLRAASTLVASNGFFDVTNGPPAKTPTRVDTSGGPPETATGILTTGTDTNTVTWYIGDASGSPARQSSVVRIDNSVSVAYGLRANEPAIRNLVSGLAAFAATKFDQNDPNVQTAYGSLSTAVRNQLGNQSGQTISSISSEIAVVQQSAKSAQTRQGSAKTVLQNLVDSANGVDKKAVATQLLQLQTDLQASYQTTSRIAQLSLVNFLN